MKSSSPPGLFACNWMGKPTKEVWIILPLYPDPGLGARSCSPSDRTCDAAATGRFFSACTRCCRGFALFSSKFLATIRKLILDSKTLLQKTHHLVIKPCSWFASPSSLIPADDKPLFTNRFTCRYLSLYPCFLYSAVVPIFIHCCCVTSSWWPMSLHFFSGGPQKIQPSAGAPSSAALVCSVSRSSAERPSWWLSLAPVSDLEARPL